MLKFDNVRCLPFALISVAFLVPLEGDAQGADVSQPPQSFYTVGHTVFELDVIGNHGEHRPIPVQVWYPSHQHEGRAAVYTSALYGVPLISGTYDALSWTTIAENAKEDLQIAPPKAGGTDHGFPVIVFSHGSVDLPIDYYITLERIASHGFIVAAPAHVNNTSDDARIDYVNAAANRMVLSCFDGLPSPCSRTSVLDSIVDRARDVSAVLDALPAWFGERADMNRVGMLGHSRGTVTAFVEAGGSATLGISPERRIKAIMGLSSGTPSVTLTANPDFANIEIPTVLVEGTLSNCNPPMCNPPVSLLATTEQDFAKIASQDKQLVLVQNAVHRTFNSGLCAQTQNSGAIAEADPRAILDFKTAKDALTSSTGLPLDFCTYSDFTSPNDIRPITLALTGVQVTPANVPRTGLTSLAVAQQVTDIAVSFFNRVLEVAP
jgi:predicted dienelactone hydrolase